MDNIKLSAKTGIRHRLADHLMRTYSSDTGMLFGLDKCTWMVSKTTEGVDLPGGSITDALGRVTLWYPKYLGIPQAISNYKEAARKSQSGTDKELEKL